MPASSTDPRFGALMAQAYRKWRRLIDAEFRNVGLSDATRAPLITLYDAQKPMRQIDIAAALGLDPSALVRVMPILAKRGLICWSLAPEDKRTKQISLTAEGRAWSERIIARSREIEARVLTNVSPDELRLVRSVLDRIIANFPDAPELLAPDDLAHTAAPSDDGQPPKA